MMKEIECFLPQCVGWRMGFEHPGAVWFFIAILVAMYVLSSIYGKRK